MMTNCPNCGAPTRGAFCEYCGAWFEKPRYDEDEVVFSYYSPKRDLLAVNEIRKLIEPEPFGNVTRR